MGLDIKFSRSVTLKDDALQTFAFDWVFQDAKEQKLGGMCMVVPQSSGWRGLSP